MRWRIFLLFPSLSSAPCYIVLQSSQCIFFIVPVLSSEPSYALEYASEHELVLRVTAQVLGKCVPVNLHYYIVIQRNFCMLLFLYNFADQYSLSGSRLCFGMAKYFMRCQWKLFRCTRLQSQFKPSINKDINYHLHS